MALEKSIVCPFCFERFGRSAVRYRCTNARCKREPDTVFADARNQRAVPMGHTFSAPTPKWWQKVISDFRSADCDECERSSSKRLCPHCHFELPLDSGMIDDHIIAIIGGRGTGKGHYIAALIHRLEHEIGKQFNFALRFIGDETRRRFDEDYRQPLFVKKQLLEPTQSAEINLNSKSPMIFRLTFSKGRRRSALNLTFFDAAGEDMQSLDALSREARYICHADAIIFLLDPLQIGAVRQQLPTAMLPPADPGAEPTFIEERLRELFEQQLNLKPEQKVKTPLAFTMSKVDTLLPIIEAGSALKLTGEHFGHFNLTDAESVHTEIENYLDSWMGGGFTNRVSGDFADFHYFGTSALGGVPNADGTVDVVAPLRVEDPLLWVLYRLGLISGRKER